VDYAHYIFWGAFAQLRKAPPLSFRRICLFVRTPARIQPVLTGLIFIEFLHWNSYETPLRKQHFG